jgi:uncharacterized protein YjbJ (UPF0337 family)
MQKRKSAAAKRSKSEFKGVVKKITGKLTSNPALEREGQREMLGKGATRPSSRNNGKRRPEPDPHRRG